MKLWCNGKNEAVWCNNNLPTYSVISLHFPCSAFDFQSVLYIFVTMAERNNNAANGEIVRRENMNQDLSINDSDYSYIAPPLPPLPPSHPAATNANDSIDEEIPPCMISPTATDHHAEVPFNLVPTTLHTNRPDKLNDHASKMLLKHSKELKLLQPLIDPTKSTEQNLKQLRDTIEHYHERIKNFAGTKYHQAVIANLPENIRKKDGNNAVCETDIWDVWTKAKRFYTDTESFLKFVCQYYILPLDNDSTWIDKARNDFEIEVRMPVQKPPSGNKDFVQKIARHFIHQQVMKRTNDYLASKGRKLLKSEPTEAQVNKYYKSYSTLVIPPVAGIDAPQKVFYLAEMKVKLPEKTVNESSSKSCDQEHFDAQAHPHHGGELRATLTNCLHKGIASNVLIEMCTSIIIEQEKSLKVRHNRCTRIPFDPL